MFLKPYSNPLWHRPYIFDIYNIQSIELPDWIKLLYRIERKEKTLTHLKPPKQNFILRINYLHQI